MVKQKKAWIKIVESFMAIVLLLGIILLVLNNVTEKELEVSIVEKNNLEMIAEIQFNESLRDAAISISPLPLNSGQAEFSGVLTTFVEENTLLGTNCTMVACGVGEECNFTQEIISEVYSSEVLIFTNKNTYSPRKLKLFCHKTQ